MVIFNARQAMDWFIRDVKPGGKVVDIGCGGNIKPMLHTPEMKGAGLKVDALDMNSKRATIRCTFEDWAVANDTYDGVWASHMLEHTENVGLFLKKCRRILKPGGIFGVTVPPVASNFGKLVPGHLSMWNPALLCYNLIVAGWNLKDARLGMYDKNISVVTARVDLKLPKLASCRGDIELLAPYFPTAVFHGCEAELKNVRWSSGG